MTNHTSKNNFGLDNDGKGRLHEILVAKLLDPQQRFPERPNEEIDKYQILASESLYYKLVQQMGGPYSENLKHHMRIAEYAAENIKRGIGTTSNNPIIKVYWTSNPSDFFALTRVKERSSADLIFDVKRTDIVVVDHTSNYIGISLKMYNRKKTQTISNPGHRLVDSLLKVNTQPILYGFLEDVKKNTLAHGHDVTGMTQKDAHQLEKLVPELLKSNSLIARAGVIQISNVYRTELEKKNSKELELFIRSIVSTKEMKMKVYRCATYGVQDLKHEFVDVALEGKQVLARHKNKVFIKPTKSKRTITFAGDEEQPIITFDIKPHGSGGFQSINCNIKGWHSGKYK